MNEIKKSIGKNIQDYRQKAKLTQSELGIKLECTRDTIASMETGRSLPSVELLINLCKVLNCSPNMLLKGTF